MHDTNNNMNKYGDIFAIARTKKKTTDFVLHT